MVTKHAEITGMLRRRIREGMYSVGNLPSERKLALELGVSYMTARKAVQSLVESRVIERDRRGRLRMRPTGQGTHPSLTIGFLMPTPDFTWGSQWAWYGELADLVARREGVVRAITYAGASDPVIFESLEADFDGLFMILPLVMSPLLTDRLAKKREKLVTLWQDTTHLGIPSIETGPARFVGKLLDHLTSLGHRRIDFLNAHSNDAGMRQRGESWRMGLEHRGVAGQLYECSAKPHQAQVHSALDFTSRLIRDREMNGSALICANTSQAWGAMRAYHEAGKRLGDEISICGFGDMDIAKLLIPRMTVVEPAARTPYLAMGLEWIESGGRNWQRPLRMEPDDVSIFVGESTGPCRS